jgi:hypothetical protein
MSAHIILPCADFAWSADLYGCSTATRLFDKFVSFFDLLGFLIG